MQMLFDRCAGLIAAVGMLCIVNGCGSPPPPPRSAQAEIHTAESALDNASVWQAKGEIDQAMRSCDEALKTIADGRSFASGTELARLNNLDQDIRNKQVDLQKLQILRQAAADRAKPVVVSTAVDPEEEKKKKALEDKKKQAAEEANAVKIQSQLNIEKAPQKKAEEEEQPPEPKKKSEPAVEASKDGEPPLPGNMVRTVQKAADGSVIITDTEKAPPKPKVPQGFPEITEKSQPVQVVKLYRKDKFVMADFQVYNKSEQTKRIMSVNVFFKTKDNQQVRSFATGVFPYRSFRANTKNPIDESSDGLTAGSHQVNGQEGMQFVAAGEFEKAADINQVTVKVIYDDGTSEYDTGPQITGDVHGLR